MSGAYQLQIALYNKLSADVTLSGLIMGIYDNPTQVADSSDNADYPYLTIGDIELDDWSTDTESGAEAIVTVHTWSRAHHTLECKQIQDAIYAALHRAELSVTGKRFVSCDFVTQNNARDPDGITIHGISQFKIFIDEV